MKAEELKELIEKCDSTKKDKLISMIYRKVSKDKKEELDSEIIALVSGEKVEKVKKERLDFASYKTEIETFIAYANYGLYFSPNRYVSKKERTNWRYVVMGFVKTLKNIDISDENYNEANELLLELYELLSYACGHYVFTSSNPFSAIGISQSSFYGMLAQRMLKVDKSEETITTLLRCATSVSLDPETLHSFMINILISILSKKDEDLYRLRDIAKANFKNDDFISEEYARDSFYDYFKKETFNNLLTVSFMVSMILSEHMSEIDYFMKNLHERNNEISLYVALDTISEEADKEWIEIYEYVKDKYKIDPRDSLKEEYEERKKKLAMN